MQCFSCEDKVCYQGRDCTKIKERAVAEYDDAFNRKVMAVSSRLEAHHYMELTRLEELLRFCDQMDFGRIGIAFCIGLAEEARILGEIVSQHMRVFSVCCKVCGVDKSEFNLPQIQNDRYEATCNPIGQALVLNKEKTDLNIIFGLCLGHDLLFTKYSEAPVSTLVVKDRVLAHNPIGTLTSGYYRRKLFKP